MKAHLSVLLALIVLLQGFNYWLDIYGLDFSPRGQVVGASYTDVHAQLPAYRILIVISIVSAVILLLNIRYQGWRLPLIAVGVWVGAAILIGAIWPALMQQFIVKPNEVEKEAPYIARNIRMTRIGVRPRRTCEAAPSPPLEDLTAADIVADRQTLQNVRLWNPEVADKVYAQLQALRQYYEFPDVDVDRYEIRRRLGSDFGDAGFDRDAAGHPPGAGRGTRGERERSCPRAPRHGSTGIWCTRTASAS